MGLETYICVPEWSADSVGGQVLHASDKCDLPPAPHCICKGEFTDPNKLCKIITNIPHLAQTGTSVTFFICSCEDTEHQKLNTFL